MYTGKDRNQPDEYPSGFFYDLTIEISTQDLGLNKDKPGLKFTLTGR